MSNIAIEFDNVGKMYRLGRVGTGTLSHDLNRWWTMNILRKEDPYLKIGETNDRSTKGHSDYVWALRDISFKVEQGDVVGIIGKNGAGKSTLLKLLSRITSPSTGSIRYNGRIASLLEVGTGFHPEMTGRENIYMNGSIMGMTKKEITRKLDEIVDFAGVERYLDTPVKRYSSGMTVRLGFAVAAFLEPEILVVDEVLTVGDAEFQKKAIGKMKDVSQGEGRTVLFVSHNMTAVRSLCNQAIMLRNGMLVEQGPTENVVTHYLRGDSGALNYKIWKDEIEYKKEGFELLEVGMKKKGGTYDDVMRMDQDMELTIRYRLKQDYDKFWVTMHYKNDQGNTIFSSGPGNQIEKKHVQGEYIQTSIVPANTLNWGNYSINVMAFHDNAQLLCNATDIISFTLANKELEIGAWMGKEPGDVTPKFFFSEMKIV